MSALLGIATALAAAFGILWARERRLRTGRSGAGREARPAAAPGRAQSAPPGLQRLLGILAHELRTPLGAIIGFQELLADGLLGPLSEPAVDGIGRIGTSAAQLRHLLDGLADLLLPMPGAADLEPEEVALGPTLEAVVASAHAVAGGRSVQLDVRLPERLATLRTDRARLTCALDLCIGAAIRGSPNRTIGLSFSGDERALSLDVTGSALDPTRDAPPEIPGDLARVGATGSALRLAMAARVLAVLGGELRLVPEGEGPAVRVRVPPLPN
jgi:signal transduction histidine kinase